MEIVKLIGSDVLPDDQKLIIETAKLVRTGFLQQNAYHPADTFVPLPKQLRMMEVILHLYHGARDAITGRGVQKHAVALSEILETGIFSRLTKFSTSITRSVRSR